ncbi:MAG: PQQ-binding-like beta-propeller repeat protein [Candidatus Omnitrophota bacterium]
MKIASLTIALFFVFLNSAYSEHDLLNENFDELSANLQPAANEFIDPSILGWTHTPPAGWSVDNSKMPFQKGMMEWHGWSFATMDFWTGADAQDRANFTLSGGVFAIADPDEWDDRNKPSASGSFESVLISPPIPVIANKPLFLYFDSHYRQEKPQEAQVLVSFDGKPDIVLLHYHSGPDSNNQGEDRENQLLVLTIPAPTNDGAMVIKWKIFNAGNNWYWAIDNVKVSDQAPPPTPAPTLVPTPTPTPPPILANGPLVHFIDEQSAQVIWETMELSPSIIEFSNGQTTRRAEDAAPKIKHQLTLNELHPESIYSFAIKTKLDGTEAFGETFHFDSTYDGGAGDFPSIASPYPEDSLTGFYETAAEKIVKETGIDKGFCLVLGFDKGRLAYEIAKRTHLKIVGVEEDAEKIAYARKCLRAAGVYGDRISVQQGNLTELPYGNYFANLIVSDRFLLTGKPVGSASETLRILRPCGGVLYLGQTKYGSADDRSAWENWLASGSIKGFLACNDDEGLWFKKTREPLPGTGEWTHYYAEPGNSACSSDQVVQAPMNVLWYGRPGPRLIVNRHSRPMSPLYKNGRVFIPADDRIIAIDAYNGTRLWDLGVPGSRRMGAFKGSAQMAAADGYVYIAQRDRCHAISATNGLPAFSLEVPQLNKNETLEWGYLSCIDDQIVGTAHKKGTPFYEYSYNGNCNELEEDGRACMISDFIFSRNRQTGELLWTYNQGAILESSIAAGDGCVYFAENRSLPASKGVWEKPGRRWVGNFTAGNNTYLTSLDLKTGEKIWERQVNLPFTEMMYLSYSNQTVVAVGSYNLAGNCRYAVYAYAADSGQPKWKDDYDSGSDPGGSHGEQWQHPVILNGNVFSRPYFYNLQTGAREKFTLNLGGRCGTYSASTRFLFARDGNPSYYEYGSLRPSSNPLCDITRPGCFINTIPVGGLVLIPESSSGCTCEYSLQTSLAFLPR